MQNLIVFLVSMVVGATVTSIGMRVVLKGGRLG